MATRARKLGATVSFAALAVASAAICLLSLTACTTDGDGGGPPQAGVVLNEIVCAAIADGKFNPIGSDWAEFYNGSLETVDLAGARLIDSKTKTFDEAIALPKGTTIPALGYIVVFFNDQGFGNPVIEKRLGSSEVLTLYGSDQTLLDQLDWSEGDCLEGGSWGRSPDGGSALRTFAAPTPNAKNP